MTYHTDFTVTGEEQVDRPKGFYCDIRRTGGQTKEILLQRTENRLTDQRDFTAADGEQVDRP